MLDILFGYVVFGYFECVYVDFRYVKCCMLCLEILSEGYLVLDSLCALDNFCVWIYCVGYFDFGYLEWLIC